MSKDEALKLALEALEVCEQSDYGRKWVWPETAHPTAMGRVREAITAIKQALDQPVQEPVGDRLRVVEGLLLKFQSVASNVARTHQKYMGKAMDDETYAHFAKARDETIPALRAELLNLYTTPPAQPAPVQPVAMRMPKVGDRVVCIDDESLGTVVYLTAGGSPEIKFDDGSHGTYMLREFAELFGYTHPSPAQPATEKSSAVQQEPAQEPVAWEASATKFAIGRQIFLHKPENLASYIRVRPLIYGDTTPPVQEIVCSTGLCHYKPAAPVQSLPFGVGGGLVAIKTLLSRDPCVHANIAIEMLDAILKEHPAAQLQQESVAWQHIESAPKDGTRILCQDEKGLVDICEWTEDRFTSSDDRTFGGHLAYTSWTPLPHSGPTPPAAKPATEKSSAAQPAPVQPVGRVCFEGDEVVWIDEPPESGSLLYTTPPAQEIMCSTGLCHYKPAAAVQEPLFWYRPCSNGMYEGPIHNAQIEEVRKQSGAWVPLVTATTPPAAQRQWVGLTDEEKQELVSNEIGRVRDYEDYADAIEAKLKEKNT